MMRAIFIFAILATFLITGCASVEIVKEVTKATKRVETSIKKILESPEPKEEEQKVLESPEPKEEEQKVLESQEQKEEEQKILVEEQIISKEQKKVSAVVTKQKKVSTINLSNKTMKELSQLIGQPNLIREDGKTIIARFDSRDCRLFVFMDSSIKMPRVEYYELRNSMGELIEDQKNIELCFKEIKPV